jgi:PAS domain S-box-containing protein
MELLRQAGTTRDVQSPAHRLPAETAGPHSDLPALFATIDRAPVGFAHLDRHGRFLFVNDRLSTILGYSRDELRERTLPEFTVPEDVPSNVALVEWLASNATSSYHDEQRFRRRDGSVVWVRLTVSAVRLGSDDIDFFLVVADDISERRTSDAARREAAERLRLALDASGTGTFRWDARTRALEWDDNLASLFGLEPSARSEDAFLARVHPDDRRRMLEAWWLCATEDVEFDEEFRVVWPDGSVHWLRERGRTSRGADGAPVYLAGACTDVTERRRAEDELRAQEERFRTLANAIPQLAWMTDAHGWVYWYNQRWYDYTGTTLEEVQGWGWQRLHHPDHVQHVVERIRHCIETGEPWEDTFPLRGSSGQYRWFLSRALPIRDAAGAIIGWFGTNTDITERLDAERALRASEAKLRRIAESGLIGIFYWTQAGAITEANDEFCRMLGWSQEDVHAGVLDWRTLTPPEWDAVGSAKDAELAARGVVTLWEKEFRARDGRRIPVLVGSAVLDAHNDRGVAVCLDISRLKEAELESERLLARERSARAEAERAIKLRDEVLGVVAHDLRNPLHTISMSTGLMLEIPLSEDERAHQLQVIRRTAKEMNRLIADLLDVTRIESGAFTLQRKPVHVGPLIEEMLELFGPQAREKGIALLAEIAPDTPTVLGDHDRLVQVLSNLVGNSLKFTNAGGSITIGVSRPTQQLDVRFSVEDTGIGIPAENLPHVFDRFWQANRASRAGAGLGLAIARGIIAAHGGGIWVESTVGVGTAFHFALPVAD